MNRICPSCFAPIFLDKSKICSKCGQPYPYEAQERKHPTNESVDKEMLKFMINAADSYMKSKQDRLDNLYMDIALRVAEMSYAQRRKVGAVIVKDNNILSFGWNGMPSGFNNVCEFDGASDPRVIHSEINALMKLARTTGNAQGATLYMTLSPCYDCAKAIIQSGITRVVYKDLYRIADALDFLKDAGIRVEAID